MLVHNTSHTCNIQPLSLPCCIIAVMLSAVTVGQKIKLTRWVEASWCWRPGVDSLRRESGRTSWLLGGGFKYVYFIFTPIWGRFPF